VGHVLAAPGISIHVEAVGTGTPVLLLPGLGATVGSWGPLLSDLAARHRCIAVDNRGSGSSDLPDGRFGMADMADDACAVLDALGVERAHVVGSSLGGMVAQALALRHPRRVRSLTLAASSPGVTSIPSHPSLAYHLLAARSRSIAARTRHLNAILHGPATIVDHPERLDESVGGLGFPSGAGVRRQLRAALRWSGLHRLRRIGVPTLVLHGSHDRLVPAVNARLMARLIPEARLHLLERAGHFFITDAPVEAAAAILGFAAGVERTAVTPAPAARRAPAVPAPVPAAAASLRVAPTT